MGDAQLPSVRLGKVDPGKTNSYNRKEVDDIEVYYPDRIASMYQTVTITIEKLLFFKRLGAMGKP